MSPNTRREAHNLRGRSGLGRNPRWSAWFRVCSRITTRAPVGLEVDPKDELSADRSLTFNLKGDGLGIGQHREMSEGDGVTERREKGVTQVHK